MPRNHNRVFRPLRGGIEILNPEIGRPGTLGMIALDDAGGRWIVSCAHVLSSKAASEPIYQPIDNDTPPTNLIARTDPVRLDSVQDCAAARIVEGVLSINEVLGIGALGEVLDPVIGMQVIKSGAETGVTEGTITSVQGDAVEIRPSGLPVDYQANAEGDSGSIWIAKNTFSPVVLHQGGTLSPRTAFGLAAGKALQLLNLRVIPRTLVAGRNP